MRAGGPGLLQPGRPIPRPPAPPTSSPAIPPHPLHPQPATHEEMADLDPSRHYLRAAPLFETASETYHWLNRTVAVGAGRITRTGVAHDGHEVL